MKGAVPLVHRIYDRYRHSLRVSHLRPWNLEVDPLGRPPLQPFREIGELEDNAAIIVSWPYIAAMDTFQHWVLTNPDAAIHPATCDTK